VISDAGAHLIAIDNAVRTRKGAGKPGSTAALDTSLLAAINPLLDILVLEGVYPSISLEIGFRDRLRNSSLLYSKESDRFPDLDMLQTVLHITDLIVFDNSGIASQVRDRILADLIIANFDLAFSPAREKSVQDASKQRLDRLLDG
jgi:hypothetical protein